MTLRRFTAASLDLVCGAALLGAAFAGTRILLADPGRVQFLFALVSTVAFGLARWRRGRGLPAWITLALLLAPLAWALATFTSTRDRMLFALLAVAAAFAAAALFVRPMRAALAILVVGNLALLPLVRPFVRSLVHSAKVDEPAPAFTLQLADATALPASALRGRVVVLDLWATWCVPCRRELPQVARVARRYSDAPEVAFFAVDSALTDVPGEAGDTPEAARAFLAAQRIDLPLAYSADGALEKALAVHGFPALVVLDRRGHIRVRHVGFVGAEDLEDELDRWIDGLREEPR
jgi:thiol-disulfide isomerase/thioredoxin